MFRAPSIWNSLLPIRVPSTESRDGELVSHGRTDPVLSGMNVTPGDSVAIVNTVPSFSGRSSTTRLSIT
jgi:hypothetical protein